MKKRKEFWLSEETINYIEDYKKKNFLKTPTEAFCEIIREHKEKHDNETANIILQFLSAEITEKIISALEDTYHLKNTLTRIRLGSNNADRNSEVILLLLNTLLAYSEHQALIEEDTLPTEEAKRIVKEKIAAYKTRSAEKQERDA